MRWEIDYGDRDWYPWFAWYPVRLLNTDTRVWWEWVERRVQNKQGYKIAAYR